MALPPKVHRRRLLVGCLPKETVHCCQIKSLQWGLVTPVLMQHTQDTVYCAPPPPLPPPRHCLLSHGVGMSECPLQRADCHYIPPPILPCALSDFEGFDQNCLRQGKRHEHWDWCPWHEGPQMLWQFYLATIHEVIPDDAVEVHFSLRRLSTQSTWPNHPLKQNKTWNPPSYCPSYPSVNQAQELQYLWC